MAAEAEVVLELEKPSLPYRSKLLVTGRVPTADRVKASPLAVLPRRSVTLPTPVKLASAARLRLNL